MRVLFLVLTISLLGACSSGTSIRVSDPDARIYVNGEYIGTGHGYYEDRRPAFSRQDVLVSREGCEQQSYSLRRNERPDLGAIVSAYYLVLPILWVTQYKRVHAYEYDCLENRHEPADNGAL
ncbi:MAG: hypothetical protein PVH89_02045 [Gammaproteobacteria bacterium]|jgi:hypothetical protein